MKNTYSAATKPPRTYTVQFGTQAIEYRLIRMPRKALSISVHPDLSVTVRAPEDIDRSEIARRVQQRAAWIVQQQRQCELYLPELPLRQYVSGETHRFLGLQYRLKILSPGGAIHLEGGLHLTGQYLQVFTQDKRSAHVQELITAWYQVQAQQIFQERLVAIYPKFGREDIPYPRIAARRMQSSWGSCSKKRLISLNIKLIQVPKEYIDYVLTHELCHLKELNHRAEFYDLLGRVMPNWQEKKKKLDRFDFGY